VGEFYAPETEGGLAYDDPALGLEWPLPVAVISEKDAQWAHLDTVESELRGRMTLAVAGEAA
jgi:dTDP-4-dehydrorhamnose 3,5-epimerase